MDVIELLGKDQKTLKLLMARILEADSDDEQSAAFNEFHSQYSTYQKGELTVFYPSFGHDSAYEVLLQRATLLHRGLGKRCESIAEMIEKDETVLLRAELSSLSHTLNELIDLDQAEIFPLAHRSLSRGLRERLGRHLEAEKHEIGLSAA